MLAESGGDYGSENEVWAYDNAVMLFSNAGGARCRSLLEGIK
jgi:hypothetical protein